MSNARNMLLHLLMLGNNNQNHTPSTIATTPEQAMRQRIKELIAEHRVSNYGKLHIIDERTGSIQKNVVIDPAYQPASAVFLIIDKEGEERYYDHQGYEVFPA
jgi:hypothetical protein